MALTQTQIIQSLGEALTWFERELAWGVPAQELNHLTGRIGELYAAMITRGQMALDINQRGYDVIGANNEKISVKTITTTSNIGFNLNTLSSVDRLMILRLNIDDEDGISVETLFDASRDEAESKLPKRGNKIWFYVRQNTRKDFDIESLDVVERARHNDYELRKYENATVKVSKRDEGDIVALPALREIAKDIGVDILFDTGTPKNTRHLGAEIIRVLNLI